MPAAITAALQHANTATMQIMDTTTTTTAPTPSTGALLQILAQKYFEFDQLVVLVIIKIFKEIIKLFRTML